MWHRLDVKYDDNLAEVYPVLCTILDRTQLNGQTFKDAVESVLAGLGDILSGRGGLSLEKQVGLFGDSSSFCRSLNTSHHRKPSGRGEDQIVRDTTLACLTPISK